MIDEIAAEAVAQLNNIDRTERRHAISVIKSACEKARDEGYEECRRLWVRAEADWKAHASEINYGDTCPTCRQVFQKIIPVKITLPAHASEPDSEHASDHKPSWRAAHAAEHDDK